MTVLLAADEVELYPANGPDTHGWTLPGTAPSWTGTGNLQLGAGLSDPRAADRGGHGPFAPATAPTGVLFLPADAEPAEGMAARIRGQVWVLSQVRLQADPTDLAGYLTCWAATVTEAPQ